MNYKIKSLLLTVISVACTSCGHFYTKGYTYKGSSAATINGAKITSALKPVGGKAGFSLSAMVYMAASETVDGPFLWRIEAEGKKGIHKTMKVHRLKVMTSKSKRSEWYPSKSLGNAVLFKPYKKEPEKAYAVFHIPRKLKVYPKEDGKITILADISVKSQKSTQRKIVRFQYQPGKEKNVEFFSVPAEIMKGMEKDPREWKSQPQNNSIEPFMINPPIYY